MNAKESKAMLQSFDISHEEWREYEWECPQTGKRHIYRIKSPVELYWRPGASTHRVVDSSGVAHCVPVEGRLGCVIRWFNPAGTPRVNF